MSAETGTALLRSWEPVTSLREISFRGLKRMYRPEEQVFAFRVRKDRGGTVLEGRSERYTAIVLIGLAGEDREAARAVLGGRSPEEVCGRLLARVERSDDLGEVALSLWAARALGIAGVNGTLRRLKAMDPAGGSFPTVEVSWALASLAFPGPEVGPGVGTERLARDIAERLKASFHERSGLFPHWPRGARAPALRSHIACFADTVYPIQALSHYHRKVGDPAALGAAGRCAETICRLQGPNGQWWWHYDVRTGRVVEGYPVYSVHQDAMAPMALFALREAGGADHGAAVMKGLGWLADPPEVGFSLIDGREGVVWRKVARREPWKLSRSLQALLSRVSPGLRLPVDLLFPPRAVDWESRPYHLGWILHAFPPR